MIPTLKALPAKESFKICLLLLDTLGSCVIEDYSFGSKDSDTNYSFLGSHLSNNKIKEFRRTIKKNINFLKKCLKDKDTDLVQLSKHKLELAGWHKYLIQHHMYLYMQNRTYGWNYLGLSLHYLLDAYYHIYIKLTATAPVCCWCDKNLNHAWEEVLSQIMTHHLPTIYLYLSLSQSIYLDEGPITKEMVSTHTENMKFLLQDALKLGIINSEPPAQLLKK